MHMQSFLRESVHGDSVLYDVRTQALATFDLAGADFQLLVIRRIGRLGTDLRSPPGTIIIKLSTATQTQRFRKPLQNPNPLTGFMAPCASFGYGSSSVIIIGEPQPRFLRRESRSIMI